ncbi:hypothetical protein [Mycolicibacterium mucogenicum]|uniref:hypothetical protein n=1 Tax=Mycolicibacterium mucogenicum TaxID=56689 RepID=UPI000AC1C032|nr:hypothetical protein [Mycolicibacterium mucogenicum]
MTGKVAFFTGTAQGIVLATADALADLDAEKAATAADVIGAAGSPEDRAGLTSSAVRWAA